MTVNNKGYKLKLNKYTNTAEDKTGIHQ